MASRVQEIADALMLPFDIVATGLHLAIAVIGRRIGQGRKRVLVGAVCRGEEDPIEFHRQVERTGYRRAHPGEVNFGGHEITSANKPEHSRPWERAIDTKRYRLLGTRWGLLIVPCCAKKFKEAV